MKNILIFAISIAAVATIAIACSGFKKSKEQTNQSTTVNGFAVVELFTSEGCSSCPPADEALEAISKRYKENVYLLGFHVDYWNRLGWKDQFSTAAYTSRQQQYATVFEKDGVYTPQAIVNGSVQFVGSDENRLGSEIKKQLSSADNAMPVINAATLNNGHVEVNFYVKENESTLVNIALVQLHAMTDVKRGENEGRKLSHINIVRSFKTVDTKSTNQSVQLAMPAGLSAAGCKVIVYTQDKHTHKITGANSVAIQ